MTVITISRQFGSYGDEIAQKVCDALEYRYFDKQLILQAAAASGLSQQEIYDYSEENYKVRNFLERLFSRQQTLAEVKIWKEDNQGVRVPESVKLTEDAVLSLVQSAIRYAHHMGNVVIMGRGGQMVLRDEPDTLHVRIEAPLEDRIIRVRAGWQPYETSMDLRRAAQDLIVAKDAASIDYLQRFYGVRWDDPSLYHIILNTGKLSIDQASQVITQVAYSMSIKEEPALEPG
jgi:CMP/dCMP kinase